MKPTDARVLLTGAGGGIGQASAEALLRAGASLLLVGRSPARLAALRGSLADRAGLPAATADRRLACHAADLTQAADIPPLAGAAAAWGANVVVHGAGVPCFGRFDETDAAQMQQVLLTNLLAPMWLTQALLPHLRSRPRAQVVCIGSALGRLGLPGFSVYAASKFGLRGFAEALRRELADTGVRVQYLGPRSTRTAFNDAAVEAYNQATGTAMDTPETVADALLQLLQDEAAERFIGFPESLAVRLNGLVPTWLDGAFKPHRQHLAACASPACAPATPDPRLQPLR